jgi:hypothetical protein
LCAVPVTVVGGECENLEWSSCKLELHGDGPCNLVLPPLTHQLASGSPAKLELGGDKTFNG